MDTGVVRKIDELGRIVIPKEIRRNLNIRNGEDVSIYVKDDQIILKKYERIHSVRELSQKYIDSFRKVSDDVILISNRNEVISSSNVDYIGKSIDNFLKELINERSSTSSYNLCLDGNILNYNYYVSPIIIEGDAIGSVISICKNEVSDKSILLNSIINILISNNLC